MVLTSGNFKFTCTSHSLINIELHYMVPIGETSSIERGSTTCDKVVHKVWKGTEMDEFVIKLGFIDREGDINNKVKLFIEQNEVRCLSFTVGVGILLCSYIRTYRLTTFNKHKYVES